MNPKKIWANLGVNDLELTDKFYTALGFKPNGRHRSAELVSFSIGEDNFVINFFLKEILKKNTLTELADTQLVNEIIFTVGAESRQQADDWAKEIEKAGGSLISQPEEFGQGYYGFVFADPDGHRFNVFYMEGM